MLPAVGLVRLMAGAALVTVSGCAAAGVSVPTESVDSPDVSFEVPYSAVTDRFVRCVRDEGWDAEPDWGGGVNVPGVHFDQQSQVSAAMERCGASSGWNAANNWAVWSNEQILQLYRQEVEEHECLVALGVPSYDPPSAQTYLDTFDTVDQYYGMEPGMADPSASGLSRESLVSQCPPPTWFPNIDGF